MNTNGLGQVMNTITESSSDFYTLSYVPTNSKMDGAYRTIDVKVAGGKYKLSYRRGYFAMDRGLPAGAVEIRDAAFRQVADEAGGQSDPLLPFMDLGMPQSQDILYQAKVQPLPLAPAAGRKDNLHYGVDFSVDPQDLELKMDSDGVRHGTLNVTLLVYDRYGRIVDHWAHIASLDIKPDVYAVFEKTGVELHADIAAPAGNYWLRTGIYDHNSGKVGTLEIPLAAVKPVDTAAETKP